MRAGDRAGAAGRDAAALDFDAFLQTYERDVWGYLWRMTGDEQAAYDLAQETFVRAWQRFEQVSRYDHPKAWLFRVATNLALNYLRHSAIVLGNSAPLAAGEQQNVGGADPARQVAERDAVRRALLDLAPRQRAALVLREVQGLSCTEVARALGISGAAAKMLLFRARERFRASYERQEAR
jgi:RNA polymerase sigma-70 factor (ECF subfamily)